MVMGEMFGVSSCHQGKMEAGARQGQKKSDNKQKTGGGGQRMDGRIKRIMEGGINS